MIQLTVYSFICFKDNALYSIYFFSQAMLPVKGNVPQRVNRLCPGARRAFFCRMKCKNPPSIIKEEKDSSSECQRRKKSANSGGIFYH
jgi:hypothetical protein